VDGDATLPMTPEQLGEPYSAVITPALAVLRVVATSSAAGDPKALALTGELCKSRHARKALLRLVAVLGRWRPVLHEDELAPALLAREALVALCLAHTQCAAFVDHACHPFLGDSVRARQLIEAVEVVSPLSLPPDTALAEDEATEAIQEAEEPGAPARAATLLGRALEAVTP